MNKAEAKKRLQQIEYFKHKNENLSYYNNVGVWKMENNKKEQLVEKVESGILAQELDETDLEIKRLEEILIKEGISLTNLKKAPEYEGHLERHLATAPDDDPMFN